MNVYFVFSTLDINIGHWSFLLKTTKTYLLKRQVAALRNTRDSMVLIKTLLNALMFLISRVWVQVLVVAHEDDSPMYLELVQVKCNYRGRVVPGSLVQRFCYRLVSYID